MKSSYHVFATPGEGIPDELLEKQMRSFLESQKAENHLYEYRILKHSENGSFKGMTKYQIICDYRTEDDLKRAFKGMKPDSYKEEPHLSLMKMVSEFKVGFSNDV